MLSEVQFKLDHPMRFSRLFSTFGLLSTLLTGACGVAPASDGANVVTVSQPIVKKDTRKIYVHTMPWFTIPGAHWDQFGRNYNPQIGTYNSGDYNVIEYQLLLMKYSGIDGVIIDWPGRSTKYADLPTNADNADKIIAQTAKFGMEFTVCFEDQYATGVNDAINSMNWVRDHYFNQPNQIKINGAPALFVFGPLNIGAGDWPAVLAGTGTDPAFFELWYNTNAGGAADGTYAWIYKDGLTGVANYYQRNDQGLKTPVLYPGFNTAYPPAQQPGWSLAYDLGGDTFTSLWNLAVNAGNVLQIATWNDYTEGTMIEPTNEFGYRFLTTLQKLVGTPYGQEELQIVRSLYDARKAGNGQADVASQALARLDVAGACQVLGCTAPVRPGVGPTGSAGATGTGGSTSSGGSTSNVGGSSTGAATSTGGMTSTGTGGSTSRAGSTSSGASTSSSGGSATGPVTDATNSGGCAVSSASNRRSSAPLWLALGALAVVLRRRRGKAL